TGGTMKLTTAFALLLLVGSTLLQATERQIEIDSKVVTEHKTEVNGKRFSYSATTGTQPVWDDEGNPTATLFYSYYQRSDIKALSNRPLVISFDGGAGTASIWVHLAYTGA